MKKWLIRSSTGNASAQLVETAAGVRVRVPGKGSVFVEMSSTCAAELRCLPGVSVEEVERVGESALSQRKKLWIQAVKELKAAKTVLEPEPSVGQLEPEPPKPKRKRPRKKKK